MTHALGVVIPQPWKSNSLRARQAMQGLVRFKLGGTNRIGEN